MNSTEVIINTNSAASQPVTNLVQAQIVSTPVATNLLNNGAVNIDLNTSAVSAEIIVPQNNVPMEQYLLFFPVMAEL